MNDAAVARTSVGTGNFSTASVTGPLRADASRCSLHDVLRWARCMPFPDSADDAADEPLPLRRLHRGETLVHEHQPLEHFYMVGSGCLKLSTVEINGFEQVTSFALRGDVIGLDACSTGRHPANVMALQDTTVTVLARWTLLREQARYTTLHLLQHASSRELQRRTDAHYGPSPLAGLKRQSRQRGAAAPFVEAPIRNAAPFPHMAR